MNGANKNVFKKGNRFFALGNGSANRSANKYYVVNRSANSLNFTYSNANKNSYNKATNSNNFTVVPKAPTNNGSGNGSGNKPPNSGSGNGSGNKPPNNGRSGTNNAANLRKSQFRAFLINEQTGAPLTTNQAVQKYLSNKSNFTRNNNNRANNNANKNAFWKALNTARGQGPTRGPGVEELN